MKTVYVCRTVDGIKIYENIFEGYTLIGTLEIQEPPKEKKWVKRTDLIPDGREGTMTHLPIRKYRNAVLTYKVLEDDTK